MRASHPAALRHSSRILAIAIAIALAMGAMLPVAAPGAAPAPCNGIVHVTDVVGDGHHRETDVVDAWFTEAADGRVQAVLRISSATWRPEHSDEQVAETGYALVFTHGGATSYVRVAASPTGPHVIDYGSWSAAGANGGFARAGLTTAVLETGGSGTATIDVPAALGLGAGTVVTRAFALTYDGVTNGAPHWVDRAPGGTLPSGTTFGADFVVGACAGAIAPPVGTGSSPAGPAPATPTPTAPTTTPTSSGPGAVTAVTLVARSVRTGGGTVVIRGRVLPAAAGRPVDITRTISGRAISGRVWTAADGTWSARIPVRERTVVQAASGGISSQASTIEVTSRIRLFAYRTRGGGVVFVGRVWPAAAGLLLLLRSTEIEPFATVSLRAGRFVVRMRRAQPGAYDAVFEPADDRVIRSTSNTVTVR